MLKYILSKNKLMTSEGSEHENNFDMMRICFASIVLLSHSPELLDGNRDRELLTAVFHTISFGELGVDCFFILSGFLITSSWHRDPSILNFLSKRVFRIYPGYITAFVISVCVVGALGAKSLTTYWHGLNPAALARQVALLRPPSTPPTFTQWPYPVVNGALWTISYEFICYLIIPALGVSGLLARRRLPALLWAITLLGFAAFRVSRFHDPRTGSIEGGPIITLIRFLPMFLSGMCIYHYRLYKYDPSKKLLVALFVILLVALNEKVTAEIAIASVGAYLLIWFGHLRIKLHIFRRIPDFSYGIYLYGWPLQKLIISSQLTRDPMQVFAISWVLAVLAGYTSWFLVEKPSLQIRHLFHCR